MSDQQEFLDGEILVDNREQSPELVADNENVGGEWENQIGYQSIEQEIQDNNGVQRINDLATEEPRVLKQS